jgi:NAD+ synthase
MTDAQELKPQPVFSKESLNLQVEEETKRIVDFLTETVHRGLRRQGIVVGISGGIDSSVVLALCVKAFGPERVVGVLLPEKESSPENIPLAEELARKYGVKTLVENITPALEGFGCYRRRDEAVRRVFPQYQPGWNVKIVLPGNLLEAGTLNIFQLVISDPDGNKFLQRLPLQEYYQIVASANFKQRTRMSMLYHHAELRNYAVAGTANKNEYELGFFVKHGDGGSDIAPIQHLFKTQVYQLAAYLGVPESICSRPPTTDTYPGGGTQEEFFYRIPFSILDLVWHGYEQNIEREIIARELDLRIEQVTWVIEDIQRKQHATSFLRTPPIVIG